MKYVCTGQCLVGACPFESCIRKDSAKTVQRDLRSTPMQITEPNVPVAEGPKDNLGLAVDIGTTTVVAGLYDRPTGAAAAQTSTLNAQCAFGSDVISRIDRTQRDPNGAEELHRLIVEQIIGMTEDLLAIAGVGPEAIKDGVITGNTVMMHLLADLSPASIGASPHYVSALMGKEVFASLLGLKAPEKVYLPPSVSAFVGSDIVCGMVDLGFESPAGSRMLVDIGTNGEIALEADGACVAASTAAGPAFEAVNISCGMPAFAGAIESVRIVDGEVRCAVLGGGKPEGICGSGLIDAVAAFLCAGAIDETGAIESASRNYIEVGGQPALQLAAGVYLTQRDIREFQTAKAAIRAGIETLLNFFSMEPGDLDVLYLSGGFGEHIARGSAQTVGLVPEVRNICRCGNTALSGAIRLFDKPLRQNALTLAGKTDCLNLSTSQYFQERYVESMTFD